MSTHHLQKVVDAAKKHAVDGIVADMALMELDAIRRACKDLVDLWGYAGEGEEPFETIRSITKEAH